MNIQSERVSEEPKVANWLNRTVLGAGVTSALGDFAYETTHVVLPGFMAVLGIPAAALGAIEGTADAVSSFMKMGSGYIADKLGHRKTLVVLGYLLTPVGQLLIGIATGWHLILLGRLVSWFGKGVRGPLRDTIVAESVSPATRGRAFGFHRMMDTIGAVIGPLLGVALLSWAQGLNLKDPAQPFRIVFYMTLIPGSLSALAFLCLVKDDQTSPNPAMRFWASIRQMPTRFRKYLGAVGLFAAGDFSHSLLILGATQLLTSRMGVVHAAQTAGLLYVGRNLTQTLVSFPVGWAADRLGHKPVLIFGYAAGVLTAALTSVCFGLHMESIGVLGLLFVIAGVYTATQDALEPSLTASFVPHETRAMGYGMLGTVNGTGKLISSTCVGLIWTMFTPIAAFAAAGVAMFLGTVLLASVPMSPDQEKHGTNRM